TLRMSVIRNRWRPPFTPHTLWEDCSSSVTGQDWIAGNPNPNGVRYETLLGYTGTLSVHGTRIANPVLGALGFYYGHDGGWPYSHVVRCVGFRSDGTALVFTHGHEGNPSIQPYNYRSDFSHWRKYY